MSKVIGLSTSPYSIRVGTADVARQFGFCLIHYCLAPQYGPSPVITVCTNYKRGFVATVIKSLQGKMDLFLLLRHQFRLPFPLPFLASEQLKGSTRLTGPTWIYFVQTGQEVAQQ